MPEVRLIDETGKQLGIIAIDDAMERARSKGFDLVEVAPDSVPPVCRIMDFTKFVYEQKRKVKAARKKTVKTDIKELKLRPNIDPHDFSIKLKHGREFLEKGNKLKITMRYRAREMRHYDIGTQCVDKLVQQLSDIALVESSTRGVAQMRMQTVIMAPRKVASAGKPNAPETVPTE